MVGVVEWKHLGLMCLEEKSLQVCSEAESDEVREQRCLPSYLVETGVFNPGDRNMVPKSIEQSEKEQFAKIFSKDDWRLFKEFAEIYFQEATRLKRYNMQVSPHIKLLARNIRKRLFIGLGVELLLKAVYLKWGRGINTLSGKSRLYDLASLTSDPRDQPDADSTLSLAFLIDNLPKVITLTNNHSTLKGLKLAKVFRNKEGHVVTPNHTYVPETYRAIEGALVELYQDAFSESLEVTFSIGTGEKAVWRTSAS